METAPMPGAVVIFGATGDLAARKLFPALQSLHDRKLLNEDSVIIACGRRHYDDETFRSTLGCSADFARHICYCCGDNDSDDTYLQLKNMLSDADRRAADKNLPVFNHLFYLALGAEDMLAVCRKLALHGLLKENPASGSWIHTVFEKPFGCDLASARRLNDQLHNCMDERQIYRIDHYLGKETVQNILMLRFANLIFEPLWRAEYIDHVEITATETLGVERRGKYYDRAGALRDMFQNHMLQLLCLCAMEVPSSFDADDVCNEKVKLLRAIRPFDLNSLSSEIVRGQYISYRQEKDVAADSLTETFVAAKLYIDNWRWRNVPFYLRSGKALAHKKSEIAITFKSIPHSIFPDIAPGDLAGNVLVINIYPGEGISLTLQAKKPGPKLCIGRMRLDFDYSTLGKNSGDDAYERLLLDALSGDPALFIRNDFIEESWKLLTPVLEQWQLDPSDLEFYTVGAEGPEAAAKLIAPNFWRSLEPDEN